jgi:hypothetical protein
MCAVPLGVMPWYEISCSSGLPTPGPTNRPALRKVVVA